MDVHYSTIRNYFGYGTIFVPMYTFEIYIIFDRLFCIHTLQMIEIIVTGIPFGFDFLQKPVH